MINRKVYHSFHGINPRTIIPMIHLSLSGISHRLEIRKLSTACCQRSRARVYRGILSIAEERHRLTLEGLHSEKMGLASCFAVEEEHEDTCADSTHKDGSLIDMGSRAHVQRVTDCNGITRRYTRVATPTAIHTPVARNEVAWRLRHENRE